MKRRSALILAALSLSTLTVTTFAQEPPTVYEINLPSGGIGQIVMTMTAGEAATVAAVMVLAAITLFRVLQTATQGAKAR